jgi:aryl-alcohol dehydrogenase-like predicted oxidoreductase
VAALRERCHELLDLAHARGVRYIDVARSYGRAEEFLAGWFANRDDIDDVVVGSKWGYTYTADWRVDADLHEVKDHSLATFERQLGETRSLLGRRLSLYQIHSVTPDSPALRDPALHRALSRLAAEGVTVGISTSGPRQADAIRAALEVTVDGGQLFRSIQATWNLLERSAEPALREAREAGCLVIVKEALANGRLAGADPRLAPLPEIAGERGATVDSIALAAVLGQPWASVVLSGAATAAQLTSNLGAGALSLRSDELDRLAELAESAERYWHHRSDLPWT